MFDSLTVLLASFLSYIKSVFELNLFCITRNLSSSSTCFLNVVIWVGGFAPRWPRGSSSSANVALGDKVCLLMARLERRFNNASCFSCLVGINRAWIFSFFSLSYFFSLCTALPILGVPRALYAPDRLILNVFCAYKLFMSLFFSS